LSKESDSSSIRYSFYTPHSLRRKNLWLVNIRWVSSISLMIFAFLLFVLKLDNDQFISLASLACLLASANFILFLFLKLYKPTYLKNEEKIVLAQISVDYILLTLLIHLTGGIDSYFHFFYLFHIIIASVIFERRYPALIITAASVILFTGLVTLEYLQIIKHVGYNLESHNPFDLVLTLSIFYVTVSASTYIGLTLMMRHKKVKDLIFTQNEKLEKSEKEKMQFFRFVSHELKSPIIAVQSAINVVLDVMDVKLKPQARDMLERGRKRTVQMIEILKDLVSISYEENNETHVKELVMPCEHIPEVVDYYKPIAVEKNIKLIETVCKQRKGFQLDKFVFEKIITNLISNAVRYTPEGGKVTIKTDLDDKYWYLIVSDTGIGIPQEEQKHIFEDFYRASNAKKFEAVGTGLGMSIIKRMVEQENGEIFLKSTVGKGSTFTVRFPLQ